ncbi:MAG: aldehyde ferredoxin oxidoreductase C-terminal domain-containing protein, partial [Desulfobacula sp.]|nr:aldehyde ferredoxin oxidoreductase C-terminal domain-containing protein [Desulfobacula sp.]
TSTASVIAFAMDLFEKKLLPGHLPAHLIDDLDLSWGNAATMEKLIYQMVEGKGLGKILCLGVRKAAEIIGNGASQHAVHVKGLELTAYHPMAIMGTALGYAVSSRGGDYNNVYASLEYSWSENKAEKEFGTREAVNIKSILAKGKVIKKAVTTNIIVDSLGLCKVPVLSLLRSFNLENEVKLINGLTGLNILITDLVEVGEKIAALEKLFNIRHAKDDIEDKLPQMFINQDRDQKLIQQNFETMLQEYYRAMGWDEKGIPPEPA